MLTENDNAVFRLSPDNTYITPGETVNLDVDVSEIIPDRVTAGIINSEGSETELKVPSPEGGWKNCADSPGKIVFPQQITDGTYSLVIESWKENKLLEDYSLEIGIAGGEWIIESISLFPPQAVEGGVFNVSADLELPEEADPWMCWYINGEIYKEGFLSEGLDKIIIKASDTSETQNLRLELFVGKPAENINPVQMFNAELYTVKMKEQGQFNLGPENLYNILLHFDGSGENYTAEGTASYPAVFNNYSGCRLEKDSFIRVKERIFPEIPFSITMGIMPDKIKNSQSEEPLLTVYPSDTEETDENYVIKLILQADRKIILRINGNDAPYSYTELPDSVFEKLTFITFSILPDPLNEKGIKIIWQINGDTVFTDYKKEEFPEHAEKTDFLIGGFAGLITEFGFCVRNSKYEPSAEGDRFEFFSKAFEGENIIAAEGFEDNKINSFVKINGVYTVNDGVLKLKRGEKNSVIIPAEYTARICSENSPESILILKKPESGIKENSVEIKPEVISGSLKRTIFLLEKNTQISDNISKSFYEIYPSGSAETDVIIDNIILSEK